MHSQTALATAFVAAVLMVAGCASQPPEVRPETDTVAAVGGLPADAIQFQVDAQPDDVGVSSGTLGIADVMLRTARNSPEIQSALARVRAAQAQAEQARLLPNPVLSLALRFPESGTTIIDAGLSADLLTVLRRPGAINVADMQLRSSSAEAMTAVLDQLTAAQEHYYSIQSLEASAAVLRERREGLSRLVSLAESKLRIGEGSRLDLIALQTQRVELEVEIADREMNLRDERLALARLIGQPSSNPSWSLPAWSPPPPLQFDETACVLMALERRPEIQQRRWELEAFGYERELASWGIFDGATIGIDSERDGDWSVGPAMSLPIPLLDLGQAQRDRALATVIESRHQLTAARRQVIEETRRAYAMLAATRQNLQRVADELIPLQEERRRQAEAQFRVGQTDVTMLLIAEQELRSSKSQLIELQRKAAIAQVRLERAVGGAAALVGSTAQATTFSTTQRNP